MKTIFKFGSYIITKTKTGFALCNATGLVTTYGKTYKVYKLIVVLDKRGIWRKL